MESKEIHGILRPLCDDIQEQISYNRDERDLWNSKVRKLLDERNELNRQEDWVEGPRAGAQLMNREDNWGRGEQ